MYLIDTATLELKEFIDHTTVEYAILSHVWVHGEEMTFKDFMKRRNLQSSGYQKVKRFSELAARAGSAWAWVDTCCIKKRSSAELSEAINSMFQWYHHSTLCYAYLADFNLELSWKDGKLPRSDKVWMKRVSKDVDSIDVGQFAASYYFTRGWTLQEMLAPCSLIFLDCKWRAIGDKMTLARPSRRLLASKNFFGEVTATTLPPSQCGCLGLWKGERPASRIVHTACLAYSKSIYHLCMGKATWLSSACTRRFAAHLAGNTISRCFYRIPCVTDIQ